MSEFLSRWMLALLAIAATSIIAWVGFRAGFYVTKVRRSRFRIRSPLEDESFYERYYNSSGLQKSIVIALRHELASAYDIDASRLLATDRFRNELALVRGWEYHDDAHDELFLLNRDRERRLGVKIPLGEFQTVDDYIRTIAKYEATR